MVNLRTRRCGLQSADSLECASKVVPPRLICVGSQDVCVSRRVVRAKSSLYDLCERVAFKMAGNDSFLSLAGLNGPYAAELCSLFIEQVIDVPMALFRP